MQTPISLKSTERKAFQTTFADGLWDVFLGCMVLMFAIAPLLSETLGDFWSSFIFLPFWGLVYLAIWLARKYIVAPRLGTVRFSQTRKAKLRKFSIVMVTLNILILVLGVLAAFVFSRYSNFGSIGLFLVAFLILAGFTVAAYLLDFARLYVYGLMLSITPLVGEWLYYNHGATHHGFPIAFGITAGVMIVTGLVVFVRLLGRNPTVEVPEIEG